MDEQLSGTGTIQREDRAQVPVTYSFKIHTNVVRKPGFPAVPGKRDGRGTVSAVSGELLPEGVYQLRTSDGAQLRVQKLGSVWHILAPA